MKIVLQRGHVGRTSGATGAPGEQAFAIDTTQRAVARLSALGHSVHVIDADVSSYRYRGDLFAALHYDSSSSSSAHGASVGYQTDEGKRLAEAWKRHYAANGWTRGFRPDNYTAALAGYYGVRRAVAEGNETAVILEAGFHSNPEDAALLRSPAGPDRVAIALAAAVVDLTGCNCPPEPPAVVTPARVRRTILLPRTVDRGDVGGNVRKAQGLLVGHGYDIAVDGDFGGVTDRTVRSFQRSHGLGIDGVVGPATWTELVET